MQAESVPQQTVISKNSADPDPGFVGGLEEEAAKEPETIKEEPPASEPVKEEAPLEPPKQRTSQIKDDAVEEACVAPGSEYVIEVEKPSTGLGLELLQAAENVMPAIITGIGSGSPVTGKGSKYDRIMDVNGSGSKVEDIIKAIKDNTALKITLRKPKEFNVFVNKTAGQSLGIEFCYVRTEGGEESLLINSFVDGQLISELNKQYADRAIRSKDLLMDVNGVKGCDAMIEEIKNKNELDLRFYRHFKGTEVPS